MTHLVSVLHSVSSLEKVTGGPARSVTALCDGLAKHNFDLHLISTLHSGCAREVIMPHDENVHMHLLQPIEFMEKIGLNIIPRFYEQIFAICIKHGVDLIHDHGIWQQINHCVARVAKTLKIHRIVQPRGMLEKWALDHKARKKKIAWLMYQKRDLMNAHLLVATGANEFESFRKLGLRQPIAIIPNPTPIPTLVKKPKDAERTRVMLFLSRIHPVKGLLNLVESWSIARPEGWKLAIAGYDEGNHYAEVKKAVKIAGIQDQIDMLGPADEKMKEDLFARSDLFVLPSFSENFGLVISEAMSHGIPVITTTGTPWRQIKDFNLGWYVEPTPFSIAHAIAEATALSDLHREEMGLRGHQYIIENFSQSKISSQLAAVYNWLRGKEPKPKSVIED